MPLFAVSSLSLGSCVHHSLYNKLEAARNAGFTAVDLYGDDWIQFKREYATATSLPPSAFDGDPTSIEAAKQVRLICDHFGLKLLCLQPFRDFEGRLDATEAEERMRDARGTLSVLPYLGTDMLLIPSSTLPAHKITKDRHHIADDLGRLADCANSFSPPLRVCYEALSWGTHVSTWRDAWQVIQLANRANLGLCVDSFNTAARQWADPFQPNGKLNEAVDDALRRDLLELVKIVPAQSIFYFQVADGKFMQPPLLPPTDPDEPRLRPWSRGNRLFPLEIELGAYLPVKPFTEAVLATGFDGAWCIEVFNNSLQDPHPAVPNSHARRAMASLIALENAVQFPVRRTLPAMETELKSSNNGLSSALPVFSKRSAVLLSGLTLLSLAVFLYARHV